MALNGLDASGVSGGPAFSADLQAEIRQRQIPATKLDVPQGGLDGSKRDPSGGEGQWKKQERLTNQQGPIREQKGTNWSRFNGQRQTGVDLTPASGTVSIDQPKGPAKQLVATTPGPWSQRAAELEEKVRDHGEPVGIDATVHLPVGDTSPNTPVARRSRGRRNHRRPFRLVGA